jgi:hypothetical protein
MSAPSDRTESSRKMTLSRAPGPVRNTSPKRTSLRMQAVPRPAAGELYAGRPLEPSFDADDLGVCWRGGRPSDRQWIENLSPTHTADFGPDLEFLGPGCSVLGGSDIIAAEMEEVVDLIVG